MDYPGIAPSTQSCVFYRYFGIKMKAEWLWFAVVKRVNNGLNIAADTMFIVLLLRS